MMAPPAGALAGAAARRAGAVAGHVAPGGGHAERRGPAQDHAPPGHRRGLGPPGVRPGLREHGGGTEQGVLHRRGAGRAAVPRLSHRGAGGELLLLGDGLPGHLRAPALAGAGGPLGGGRHAPQRPPRGRAAVHRRPPPRLAPHGGDDDGHGRPRRVPPRGQPRHRGERHLQGLGGARRPPPPQQGLGYAESFLYMLDAAADGSTGYRPNPRLAKALDIMFVLHAEHEMNCSTAAARHLASSGVDVYTAISGATGALYGPLHGGANEAVLRMLDRIGTVENIPAFLEGVKNREEKLFGFGHRVYKNFDPRAKIIRRVADEVFEITGKDPLIQVATELERAALTDEYFVKRKLYPNVDFYSGLVYRAMGFPPDFFTCLFTIPRCAGWLAHWRESLDDPDARIIRPQQDYQGVWLRHYEPLEARPDVVAGDDVTPLEPSNAYKRRLAGTGAW